MRSGHSSPAFEMRVLTYVKSLWLVSVNSNGRDGPQVQAIEEPWPVPLHSDTFSSTVYIISSVQSLSCAAPQASLSITNSQSPPKLMSIELVMPSNHPLSSPSPPTFNLFQHQGLFQWVCSSHQVAKALEIQLQHQSFQWTPRTDLL